LSRRVVALAIETGISVSQWWSEDEADLATALDLMEEERKRQESEQRKHGGRGAPRDDGGRVMGGGG
jgi:hypothetical protein